MSNAPAPRVDVDLLARAQAGDQDAWTAVVYRPHVAAIKAYCFRLLTDPDEAEDVTADTFIKAHTKFSRLLGDEDPNIRAWLFSICTNACLDVLRRRQRLRWLPWEGPKHDHLLVGPRLDDPEQGVISHETRVMVRLILGRMTRRHRVALILRELDGLSCAEIGEVFGISCSAAKSMLFRAREEFRRVHNRLDAENRAKERVSA